MVIPLSLLGPRVFEIFDVVSARVSEGKLAGVLLTQLASLDYCALESLHGGLGILDSMVLDEAEGGL